MLRTTAGSVQWAGAALSFINARAVSNILFKRKRMSHQQCFSRCFIVSALLFCIRQQTMAQDGGMLPPVIYQAAKNVETRWSSFENIKAEKGKGGMENNGAKGHPYEPIAPGQSKVLLDTKGPGIINRIWMTINDRSPQMLRSLKLEMFWDGEARPAVAVPLGDFFGVGLGRTATFQNVYFAQPEGRSFSCFIPMPFRKSAKVVITNESDKPLGNLFFDINFQLINNWNPDNLYFHAYFNRDTATTLAEDFILLPTISGTGRFLGTNIGVTTNPLYKNTWWGEGEVKMFLDGDNRFPTLVGTGTEDYIGTGWGQGQFVNAYSGSTIADEKGGLWAFYRYHVPDPVYFKQQCKVTLQMIGGQSKTIVAGLQKAGVPLIPVTIDAGKFHHYYQKDSILSLDKEGLPDGWVNFYRSDDVSAVAYFYLDKPANKLPPLQPISMRTANLRTQPATK
jgi:hypothetical protein